jgi:hypothetical protein
VAHGWAAPRRHRDRVGRGHEAGKETTTAAVVHDDDAGKRRPPSTELNFFEILFRFDLYVCDKLIRILYLS